MNMKILLFTMGLILSFNAFAQQAYVCKHGEVIRSIDIVYATPEKVIPCKVVYKKSTGSQTFWSTETEIGYCESKAEAFANKKIYEGWTCTAQSDLQYDVVQKTLTEGHRISLF